MVSKTLLESYGHGNSIVKPIDLAKECLRLRGLIMEMAPACGHAAGHEADCPICEIVRDEKHE